MRYYFFVYGGEWGEGKRCSDYIISFTTENIFRFFTDVSKVTVESGGMREVHTYLLISLRSLKLAAISTIICLLIGYPIAYIMARAKCRT